MRERVRVRVRVSECGRKIRNANHMPKSDDRTESNLRRGRREGRWEEDKETRRRRGEVGRGDGGGRGCERVTRAYTVEVQTASVFCSRRVLSYIS